MGFTLIELLIVLLLISIVLSFVFLSPGAFQNKKFKGEKFANELMASIQLAQAQSILNQQVIRFKFDETLYGFQHMQSINSFQTKWQWFEIDRYLAQRSLPRNTIIEAQANDLNQDIIFYPNSEITPFKIYISQANDQVASLSGSASGQLLLEIKHAE